MGPASVAAPPTQDAEDAMPRTRPSRPSRPDRSLVISTYGELEGVVRAFGDGRINLLILVGERGLGKSEAVREAVGDRAVVIRNGPSAFWLYKTAYEHRGRTLVVDDHDDLSGDRDQVR